MADEESTLKAVWQAVEKIEKRVMPFMKTVEDLNGNVDMMVEELRDIKENLEYDIGALVRGETLEIKKQIFADLFQELYPEVQELFKKQVVKVKRSKKK